MDFTLNDEQRMLDDTVNRLVRERYGFEQRIRYGREPKGYSDETWALLAELGLLSVPFAEEDGGIGGGGVELMVLHQAFGRGLTLEPYLATVVLGGGLVARLGSAEQRAALLPAVIAGELTLALAYGEPAGRYEPLWIETRAGRSGDGWRLTGRKAVVLNGDGAGRLLVTARTAGQPGERDGVSVFLVDPAQPGVTLRGYPTIDGLRAAELTLDGAELPADALLGREGAAADALEAVLAAGCAALAAEAVGAMEAACELTLDYLKTRQQFGGPIGRFQVLQHRMVDMRIALEQARSMAILAACSLDRPAAERERRIAAAKVLIGRSGRFIAEQAIQMHGGMGMTEEAAISHYAKRLVMIDHWLGDADHHLARFAALPEAEGGLEQAA
ncbi:acyl-CoA dehydrogenase family protein [Azospirillum thermophilum]|uniref:Pimeloyl-CoA dehydrogenase small subunit n=1 Tax=Azospirillum thermophilum TaxID=2202148 RepID=A0A2S2CMM3_9PROT|nr:acyl-CoA dehydrogenase [Azospirillum thermophilum]AWK85712.1 pimeloyl-CoA dehydrogenase small subunit [Azospirillum thermophilum]